MSENEIPKETQDSYNAVKMLAMTHSLLSNAHIPFTRTEQTAMALEFIAALHKQSFDKLVEDPHAGAFEEIKRYKESLNGSAKEEISDISADDSQSSTAL